MSAVQEIATAVRKTRKAMGLRQDQLAAAAGVGVRFLIELEAGKTSAHLGKTIAVLDALGLDVLLRPRSAQPAVAADESESPSRS